MIPARWRLGSRNPYTVYEVADGAHDVEHAREHFVCAFRREKDADLAVDAVNAWAARWADPLSLDELTAVAEAAFECADITVEVREADGTVSSLRRLVRCLRSAGLLDERRDRDDDETEEDARLAVDAVNAQPATDDDERAERELTDALHIVRTAQSELLAANPKDAGVDELDQAARLLIRWRPSAVKARRRAQPTTPPTCDCPDTDGAPVLRVDREADAAYLALDDARAHRVARTVQLGHGIAVDLDEDNVRVRGVQTYTGYEDRLAGEPPRRGNTLRLVETESGMTVDGVVTETDDDKQLIYVAVDWSRLRTPDDVPAGSAVGQRGAPTRDVLVEAFKRAEVVLGPPGAAHFAEPKFGCPSDREAERMADVALAALRDGGADTGGEGEFLRPGDEVMVWGAERNRGYAVGTVESGGTFPRGIAEPVVHLRHTNFEQRDEPDEDVEPRCGAFHSEYGFTCPYLPNGHGRWHWDPAGGYWDAAGQYIDGAEDVAEQPDDGANASGKGAEESSYTEQVAARVRAALGADPVNEAILCDLSRAVNQVHDDLDEAMSWHRRELQRVGIALTGLMLRLDHTSGDGRRWVTVEADPETGEPLTTEHHRIAESVAAHALDETRTRLSTALGVSLDPDDPDPVGRLVETAGKATECGCSTLLDAVNKRFDAAQDDVEAVSAVLARAGHRDRENRETLAERVARALRFERRLGAEEAVPKPEVVSGAEAAELPENSIVVECYADGTPFHGYETHVVRGLPGRDDPAAEQPCRVLYRAPAPAPAALAVGEVVESAADLDRRATVGTIVEDADGHLGKRMEEIKLEGSDEPGRWVSNADWADSGYLAGLLDFPVTVVRVGTGGGGS